MDGSTTRESKERSGRAWLRGRAVGGQRRGGEVATGLGAAVEAGGGGE
jgi:hypothetical protein